MLMGFNGVAVGSADDPVLDIVTTILSDGRTSRLYRKLVEDERIASSVDAGNNSGRNLSVELLKGMDRKKAEEMVFAEIERLAGESVSDEELNRARRKILASVVFGRESVHSLANSIASTTMNPGGEDVVKYYQD
jgi:zinc protease